MHRVFIVTGLKEGDREDKVQIVKFDPLSRREEVLGVIEHDYGLSDTCMCCVRDRVFLVGVMLPTNLVSAFNVAIRRPQPVAQLREKRTVCAVASSKHELLVCGGRGIDWNSLSSCEVLHVGRNAWQKIPNLQQERGSCQVVWLPTGHIFAIGGFNDSEFSLSSVELLNRRWDEVGASADESWRFVAPMLTKRSAFGAVSLDGGNELLVAGGFNIHDLNSAEIFAPASEHGQWTRVQPMRSATWIFSGVVWNGAVYMFGSHKHVNIQRLNLMTGESKGHWRWDQVDVLQSVSYSIRATFLK